VGSGSGVADVAVPIVLATGVAAARLALLGLVRSRARERTMAALAAALGLVPVLMTMLYVLTSDGR
jgi:beta-lactamase regulating signal transducer with metallopeptidase domain